MLINNREYFEILKNIKKQIKTAQYKAVLGANKELMELYWNIGKTIIANTKYGTNFIENLSRDIQSEFPDIQGFSVRNLKYMRKFAEVYSDFQKVQRGVALLPWRNNLTLISKIKTKDKLTAEYALKDINKPIGVSEYKLSDFVPKELLDTLPSAEDIEKRVKLEFDVAEDPQQHKPASEKRTLRVAVR
ncbi:MAG: DUF1016 N-terminal domain-containing protein [Fibromonadaceae bacterium]|jgi:predicted nuclease of restriction endonuclease-like (RecB) superfamily|nr:DUF1016 N-terminal domain-containing protein [Fibromonadaceae bacterium]